MGGGGGGRNSLYTMLTVMVGTSVSYVAALTVGIGRVCMLC